MTKIELTDEQAVLFRKFMEHYDTIGYILGYMDSLKVYDLKNSSIQFDIDNNEAIRHMSIQKHFRV